MIKGKQNIQSTIWLEIDATDFFFFFLWFGQNHWLYRFRAAISIAPSVEVNAATYYRLPFVTMTSLWLEWINWKVSGYLNPIRQNKRKEKQVLVYCRHACYISRTVRKHFRFISFSFYFSSSLQSDLNIS